MSWLSKLFGADDKKYEAPAAPVIPQITDYPIGKSLNERILAALNQGAGIGYPEEFVGRSTSPLVASREAGFNLKELPFLNAQYGGRGLSRSTLAARDIGQAYAQKERDVNELIANAYAQNESQKKADTARYENLGYGFAGGQQATGQAQAQADYNQKLMNLQLQQQYNQQQAQVLPRALGAGLSIGLAPFTGGASLMGLANSLGGGGGGGTGIDWTTMFNQATAARNASPYLTAGGEYPNISMRINPYEAMIGRG